MYIKRDVTFDRLLSHNVRKWKNKVALVDFIKDYYLTNSDSERDAIEAFIHDASFGIASGGMWIVYNKDIIDEFYKPYRDELVGVVMNHIHGRENADVRKAMREGTECDNPEFWPVIASVILTLVDEVFYSWAGRLARLLGLSTPRSTFQRLC